MSICLIISGGDFSPIPEKTEYDFVIACDHGYDNARSLGIKPDLIVGDFDSCLSAPSEYEGIQALSFPSRKDESDTMLAIKYALSKGYEHLILCCALGGRFDHVMANIQSMAYVAAEGRKCEIISESEYLCTFAGGRISLPRMEGYSLSVFALSDTCRHVTISGSVYDCEDITIANNFPIGLSNEWKNDQITIEMEEGIMLIVCSGMPVLYSRI